MAKHNAQALAKRAANADNAKRFPPRDALRKRRERRLRVAAREKRYAAVMDLTRTAAEPPEERRQRKPWTET